MRPMRHHPVRRQVALLAVASMLTSPMTPVIQAQAPAPKAAPARPRRRHRRPRWPCRARRPSPRPRVPHCSGRRRRRPTAAGRVRTRRQRRQGAGVPAAGRRVDRPEAHDGLRAPCRGRPDGAAKPTLGSLKLESRHEVSMAERLVKFSSLKITEANFPQVPKEQVREVVDEIDEGHPRRGAHHRPRPGARQRRHERDHPQGGQGRASPTRR